MAKRILKIVVEHSPDDDPDTSYLYQDGFEDRRQQWLDGQFHFIGIYSKAIVQLSDSLMQTIKSGGLWGIESDSSRDYLKEIEREEINQLTKELEAIGFSQSIIKSAIHKYL